MTDTAQVDRTLGQLGEAGAPPSSAGMLTAADGTTRITMVNAAGAAVVDPNRAEIERQIQGEGFFWLDVHEPTPGDIEMLGELFGFHPLALEDSANFGQRPKVDPYDGHLFLVVYGASRDDDGAVEVHCFSSEHYLVTVHHDECPVFAELHRRSMGRPEELANGAMLLYRVIDGLTDSFFPALADVDERIEVLQAEIFADPQQEHVREIFAMKQRLVGVRRVIEAQRDMVATFTRGDIRVPGANGETRRHFRDVHDHLIRLAGMIDAHRDLLTGVIEVYLLTVANRRDHIVKQLSVVAAILLPITFITGFFGQNFAFMTDHLIASPAAFVAGTILQIATVVAILAFFKRRKFI